MIGSVTFFRRMIKGIVFVLFPLTAIMLAILTVLYCNNADKYESRIYELTERIERLESGNVASNTDFSNIVASNTDFSNESESADIPTPTPPVVSPTEVLARRAAYLTFDDGPSEHTNEILDILDEYDVKATFFVCNKYFNGYDTLLKRIVDEGHSIGLHTASHDYKKIYKSADAFIQDMDANLAYVYKATGVSPRIMRFAGGSANGYNASVREAILYRLAERGMRSFDWNVSTGDADKPLPDADKIIGNVLNSIKGKERLIILAHDTASKTETVKALPQIIEGVLEMGYSFECITEETEEIRLPAN